LSEEDFIRQLPNTFDTDGETLYQGRNAVKRFIIEGKPLIVKRFKKMDLLKKIEWILGRCKAKRAFNNAEKLISLGFSTPQPFAYIVDDNSFSYLITAEDQGIPLLDGMNKEEEYPQLAEAFAEFAFSLHNSGVIHKDFNNTNIRFFRNNFEEGYHFSLIDINRMSFSDSRPSQRACLNNLHLFSECTEFYRIVLRKYLQLSDSFSQQTFDSELKKKIKHDDSYRRKKAFTRKLKNIFHKQN